MPFLLTDEMRRLIADARRRAAGGDTSDDGSSSGGGNPFNDIPSQAPPKTIPYWEPGKLYQPGSLVQANDYGTVAQTALTNPSFESGNTGWTLSSAFSIENVAGFKGSWRAKFTGQSPGFLFWSGNNKAQRTNDFATISDYNPGGSDKLMASSGSRLVIVPAGLSSAAAYYSDDGVTFNAATTVPWSGAGTFRQVWYDGSAGNGLFVLAFQSSDTRYWTSPDGITWTERAWPSAILPEYVYGRNGNTYAVVNDGLGNYDLLVSSSGTGSWTTVVNNIGMRTNSKFIDNGTTIVAFGYDTGDLEIWESNAAGTSFTQNTTGSTNLDAAANVDSNFWVAYNPTSGRYVWARTGTTGAATTNDTVYSDDLNTWTAAASYRSIGTYYSTVMKEFVAWTWTDQFVRSADGITWQIDSAIAAMDIWESWGNADLVLPVTLHTATNNDRATSFPGQVVSATAKVITGAESLGQIGISFYNSGGTLLKTEYGTALSGASSNYREIEVSAIAPLNTATVSVTLAASGPNDVIFDFVEWDHFTQQEKIALIFEATSAAAGTTDEVEPTWPTVIGNTVVDNEITWTARSANCILWEAKPILLSGDTEPVWPLEEGATVEDNTILWTADSGRVKDENCPQSKQVAIIASKVFAADDDIIPFSATTNPMDWSSANDAGFIPFGLNTYGSEPVSALGIYRSNLVAWNSKAFQMWQVDEDPQNMALLDAVPVGNPYAHSGQAVSNDLVWLTDKGVRSMGIAGASENLQAGFFGKQIDPLVKAAISGISNIDDIISLYYPGQGQYWIIFGAEAFVLTMNGGKQDMSWSRYVFPSSIDAWTIKDGVLYLRSGDKVWEFDEDTLRDDEGGANVQFTGRLWWPYLDFGALGVTKQMIGFDVVADGTFNITFGYNQKDDTQATTSYQIAGDTLVGDVIPMPLAAPSFQMRLEFVGNEAWEWSASALHLQDWRTTS